MSRLQLRILDMEADGLELAVIADRLGLPLIRVKRIQARAQSQLGTGSRAGMVGELYRTGVFVRRPVPSSVLLPVLTAVGVAPLPLVARGRSNAEIAAVLGITEAAANSRVRWLLRAFGASNRAHLVRLTVDAGVLSPLLNLVGAE